MQCEPQLAVLIPAFNAELYIEEAISSVNAQSDDLPTTIIVVDDGSTDGTAAVLKGLQKTVSNLEVVRQENAGVSAARNKLLELVPASTQYVMFLDADDAMAPGRIARDISLLAEDPTCEMVYGRLQLVPVSGIPLWDIELGTGTCLRGVSVTTATFRESALRRIGLFDTGMSHAEDLDFLLRYFEVSSNYMLLDDISVLYRRNAGPTATSDSRALQSGAMRALLYHAQRCRRDTKRRRVDGIFEMDRLLTAYEDR